MKKIFKSKYSQLALDLFVVLCAVILFEKILGHIGIIFNTILISLNFFIDIIIPFIYAGAIAFVLKPAVNWIERRINALQEKYNKKIIFSRKVIRILSIFTVYLTGFLFIFFTLRYIIPEVIQSGRDFMANVPNQILDIQNKLKDNYNLDIPIEYQRILEFMQTSLKETVNSVEGLKDLSLNIFARAMDLLNWLIGVIISFYILIDKEEIYEGIKKLIHTFFNKSKAEGLVSFLNLSDDIFERFIIGKAIDSIIIGILCYIGLTAMQFEYTVFGSTVVGVTNMIPFFGPFIGAVPVILLALLNNGIWYALGIALFIFVLQQFDGVILGPMILGDKLGIKPIDVIFSITIGGALFGIVGMFLGVPTFTIIRIYLAKYINSKAKDKNGKHLIFSDNKKE